MADAVDAAVRVGLETVFGVFPLTTNTFIFLMLMLTVPLKKFATTAKRQTPSTAFDGFGAARRLEPSVASRQTPGGVGG